jgi:hypothetical protein
METPGNNRQEFINNIETVCFKELMIIRQIASNMVEIEHNITLAHTLYFRLGNWGFDRIAARKNDETERQADREIMLVEQAERYQHAFYDYVFSQIPERFSKSGMYLKLSDVIDAMPYG